jgi:hypothetical protein
MGDVADAVARRRIPNAESPARALQKAMVVGIKIVDLQKIVIDVLRADLSIHAFETHRFQRQHDERAGRVLCERLVDLERDRFACVRGTVREVGFDQLLRDVRWHRIRLRKGRLMPLRPAQHMCDEIQNSM